MTSFCPAGTHFQVYGARTSPALVLIHGVGLDHSMWQAQVDAFASDYYVITYDLIGHGQSPQANTQTSLESLAEQLLQLLNHLNLEQVHLLGFSLGGLVARVFAVAHNHRLNSLIIMNSVFGRSAALREAILKRVAQVDEHGPSANIDQALERWFSPVYTHANAAYIAQLRCQVLSNHQTSYSRCYRLFGEGDNAALLSLNKITCPTLVITGELDPGSTPAMSIALAQQLPNANAVSVPQARHMMPVENAVQVQQYIAAFLSAQL